MNTALARAYELEKKGLTFYINSLNDSENLLVRRTIYSLAKDEISHMIKIDDISLSLDASKKWTKEDAGFNGSDIEIAIKKYFDRTDKTLFEQNKDNVAVIKSAIEFERQSYEFYDDLSKKVASDKEKRFYDELKKQEEGHFDALQNVYYYLTKTGDWFENDESNVWSWMNL